MELFGKTHIDFVGHRKVSFGLSALIVAGSLALVAVKGINYGIEFTGGALLQVTFEKPLELGAVRDGLQGQGLTPELQSVEGGNTFILREKGAEADVHAAAAKMTDALAKAFPENPLRVDSREFIGPVVGEELREKAFWAIALSMLVIVLFVAVRFSNPVWGIAGVLALFHDVIGALGLIVLLGKEVDLLVISALLTIAGYSINDSIVIFDRMREMTLHMRRESFAKLVNTSINDTLSRTIITVGLVQLTSLVLFFFGGDVLRNFSLVLVAGNFLGSYSTIAVAAPLVYEWHTRKGKH